ncbi:DUF4268 domain-containing protein [Flavihumibacter sediminis]|nr:DUF4268 domain-containing protein [Flavihumibacter sediminis]
MNIFAGMFTREEASLLKTKFFTVLGQYMQPIPAMDGGQVNWMNYRTGVKNVFFRIDAGRSYCETGMLIALPDTRERHIFFDKCQAMADFLPPVEGPEWIWLRDQADENKKMVSRIYSRLNGVSLFNQADWPTIISFIKPRLIALDAFWFEAKEVVL